MNPSRKQLARDGKPAHRRSRWLERTRGLAIATLIGLLSGVGCKTSSDTRLEEAGEAVETWDVLYAGDTKIGHAHAVIVPLQEIGGEQRFVRTTFAQDVTVMRFGQPTNQSISMTTVERANGELIEFRTKYQGSDDAMVATGRVAGDRLEIETQTKGKTETSSIHWEREWDSFFAIEQSLTASPMRAGETRSLRMLQPVTNQVANVTLKAADVEETEMLAGRQKLLRVDASIHIPGQTSKQTTWIDGSGEILKLDVPVFGFVIYRTTKEIALLPSESGGFDLGKMSMVKIERTLPDPHATRRITYRARVKDGSLDGVFTTGLSQSVKQLADKSVEVTVRAVRPDQPAEIDVPVDQPTDDDLQPNSLIQSDDERVMRLARDVVANSTNAWTIARELERHVNSKLKDVNFSQAFATAAEVAETLEGDCTEHAVLLAALCRARNIPARVAIGLVYFRGKSGEGFGYHMWTEVWITDRWVPLDATLGRGGIGAAHLKIAHSSLKGADAYSAFLPVIPVIGRLELEIVDVE